MSKVYQIITDQIIEKLKKGEIPWHMPWSNELPKNLISGKTYRGINVFLLGSQGYVNPYWLTFRQTDNLGGHIKKGEKSTIVVFWKLWEKENDKGEMQSIPVLRYFRVFNVDQVKLPAEEMPEVVTHQIEPIPAARSIIESMFDCPRIETGNQASYSASLDRVLMPDPQAFDKAEEYYSTLFHELTHSTGHESRLGRFASDDTVTNPYGSRTYSKEELLAEMGAAFLCSVSGIMDRILDNSTAYIQGWLKVLQNDPKFVVLAAASAQKAADYIRGIKFGKDGGK